jgi:hypothetical protein
MLYILPRSITPEIDQYLVTIPFWTFWQPTHPQGHKAQTLMAWLYASFCNTISFTHIQWPTEVTLPPIQNPVQLTLLILCQVRFQIVTLLKLIYASTLTRRQNSSVRVVTRVQATWYGIPYPVGTIIFHISNNVQTGPRAHTGSYSVHSRGKVATDWSWPIMDI